MKTIANLAQSPNTIHFALATSNGKGPNIGPLSASTCVHLADLATKTHINHQMLGCHLCCLTKSLSHPRLTQHLASVHGASNVCKLHHTGRRQDNQYLQPVLNMTLAWCHSHPNDEAYASRFFVIQIKYRKVSWLGPSAATTPRGKTGSAGEISSVLPTATADTSATLHAFSIGFGESGAACAAMGRTGQHQPAKLKSNAQS